MYVLGILKSPFMSPYGPGGKPMIAIENLDYMNYLRFALNAMSPEETLPLFNPWIMSVHDYGITDAELPALESLDRSTLQKSPLLLCFNGLAVYIYVGKQCDPYLIQLIFKVQEFTQINKNMGEWDIFPETHDVADTSYLAVLQRIINNSIRTQR